MCLWALASDWTLLQELSGWMRFRQNPSNLTSEAICKHRQEKKQERYKKGEKLKKGVRQGQGEKKREVMRDRERK